MGKTKAMRPLFFVLGLGFYNSLYAATCEYNILNEWGTGFTAQVRIVNDSLQPIEGWYVSWSYTDGTQVPRTWDAELSGENPYTAKNLSYNRRIAANSSTTFGFNGYKATQGAAAEIPELSGICAPEAVNQPPIASISANPAQGSTPLTVTFDASGSTDPENDVLTYRWNFGNGDTATGANVTRTFDTAGSYSVSLIANDGQLDSSPTFTTIVASEPSTDPVDGFVLDAANSSLFFVSTKQTHVLERHEFTDLYGSISSAGEATLGINLSSIESGIAIRNERMRNFLFEVDMFSEAQVTVPVDLAALATQAIGGTVTQSIAATLNLHGVSAAIDTDVVVTKLSDSQMMVQNVSPILIKAADYDLTGGIDQLRNIANLRSISYTVPVNFNLLFNTASAQ